MAVGDGGAQVLSFFRRRYLRGRMPFRCGRKDISFAATLLGGFFIISFQLLAKNDHPEEVQRVTTRRMLATSTGCDKILDDMDDWEKSPGGLVLYLIGIAFLFQGIAIIADDYFVSSLEIISERLQLSENVAGATFMAAGSSGPELFGSLMSLANPNSAGDLGIGTIVGSAVFNILVIIGVTAICSGKTLDLDWKPLIRDFAFYVAAVGSLFGFFADEVVEWWEGLISVFLYSTYVIFLRYDASIWELVDRKMSRKKSVVPELMPHGADEGDEDVEKDGQVRDAYAPSLPPIKSGKELEITTPRDAIADQTHNGTGEKPENPSVQSVNSVSAEGSSQSRLQRYSLHRRPSALINVVHHISDEQAHSLPTSRGESVSLRRIIPSGERAGTVQRLSSPGNASSGNAFGSQGPSNQQTQKETSSLQHIPMTRTGQGQKPSMVDSRQDTLTYPSIAPAASRKQSKEHDGREKGEQEHGGAKGPGQGQEPAEGEGEDEADPLKPPSTWLGVPMWIVRLPWYIAFRFTVPDCTKEKWQKWYIVTFIMSIIWIGGTSFLVVDWAERISCAVGVPSFLFGVVILAAGTSVPDAIGSIVVAKQGMGDMAVANAVGSNIFDIWLGMGLPWLIVLPIYKTSLDAASNALLPNIIALLLVLVFYIVAVAIFGFKMSPAFGYTFLGVYVIFLVFNIVLVWLLELFGSVEKG